MQAVAKLMAGLLAVGALTSAFLGFNFLPFIIETLNSMVGFIVLLIFVVLISNDNQC